VVRKRETKRERARQKKEQVAVRCNELQCGAGSDSVLQCNAMYCIGLQLQCFTLFRASQCVGSVLQCNAVRCSIFVAVCMLLCSAARGSVWQCVAVCCSVL